MNYLYNGVELPALPEWDKTVYPYAVIIPYGGTYSLEIFDKKISYIGIGTQANGTEFPCRYYDGVPVIGYFDFKDGEWVFDGYYTEDDNSVREYGTIWTNSDIHNEDGSVYLADSDPIPVNPAPTLDPTSMLMGWKAGNWVARQRGKA